MRLICLPIIPTTKVPKPHSLKPWQPHLDSQLAPASSATRLDDPTLPGLSALKMIRAYSCLDVRAIAQLSILPPISNSRQRVLGLTLVIMHPDGDLPVRICEVRIVLQNFQEGLGLECIWPLLSPIQVDPKEHETPGAYEVIGEGATPLFYLRPSPESPKRQSCSARRRYRIGSGGRI